MKVTNNFFILTKDINTNPFTGAASAINILEEIRFQDNKENNSNGYRFEFFAMTRNIFTFDQTDGDTVEIDMPIEVITPSGKKDYLNDFAGNKIKTTLTIDKPDIVSGKSTSLGTILPCSYLFNEDGEYKFKLSQNGDVVSEYSLFIRIDKEG